MICSDFIIFMALAIISDLKSKLLISDLNECLSCLKHLEGIVDVENCLNFATVASQLIPESMLVCNLMKKGMSKNDEAFAGEFYEKRPWEIPYTEEALSKINSFQITVFELMMSLDMKPIILDVRPEKEYNTVFLKDLIVCIDLKKLQFLIVSQ